MDETIMLGKDDKQVESHVLENLDEVFAVANIRMVGGLTPDELDRDLIEVIDIQKVVMPMGMEVHHHVMMKTSTIVRRDRIVPPSGGPGSTMKRRGFEDIDVEIYAMIRSSDIGCVIESDVLGYIAE